MLIYIQCILSSILNIVQVSSVIKLIRKVLYCSVIRIMHFSVNGNHVIKYEALNTVLNVPSLVGLFV